jgi:hypothetical protein
MIKDKNQRENIKISIDKHMKRYKYPSSESLDEDLLESMLKAEQNQTTTNFSEE